MPGGTAVAALRLAAALVDRGDVEVMGVAAAHRHAPLPPWQPPVGVAMRHLPMPRLALYEAWQRFRHPRVQRATGPIDVLHATTIVVPPPSAPMVLTMHDLAFVHHPEMFTAQGLRTFRRGLDLARRDADLVLCPSEATAQDCRANGFRPERLRVVPHGVDHRRATEADVVAVRLRYRLARPYILFTGTLEPRKNLRRLLQAFRLLDTGHDLAIVGPEGWGGAAREGIEGIEGRVHSIGFVTEDDLRALYAGADVFCYPSLLEGFGLPVLEAMAQATPVVTSRGTATEELVGGGVGVLVHPYDPDDIRRGLSEALTDAERLGAAGYQRSLQYTWERSAELAMAAYRELAS